jgi:hypothetical protein
MLQSEQIDKLATALAKAQGAMVNPERNRTVKVTTRGGSSYEFKYATLDAILGTIRKPLADNGLSFTQTLANGEGGKFRLVTSLLHESGQWVRSEQPILVQEQGNQAFGSALTYARRYAVTAMLGIAADEDDDANGADGNRIDDKKDRDGNRTDDKKDDLGASGKKPTPSSKGNPDATVQWASGLRDKIDASSSLTELGKFDAEVNARKDLPAVTVTFLKQRVDDRRAFLMQKPAAA